MALNPAASRQARRRWHLEPGHDPDLRFVLRDVDPLKPVVEMPTSSTRLDMLRMGDRGEPHISLAYISYQVQTLGGKPS